MSKSNNQSISIYIYIKAETSCEEHKVLPCDALLEKRIEILLNHIINKNKFKIGDSLFSLIQCFETTICFIWFNVLRLFISLSHTKLFAFSFSFFTLLLYIHMPTTLYAISSQIHSYQKQYHLPSTFQRDLHN